MKLQSGNIQNYVAESEHAIVNGTEVKKVALVDGMGNLADSNASVAITESVDGTVTTKMITKTIGALSYVKSVATDSSDNSVTVSSWSVLA